jgi:hypothetical protein
MSFFSWGKTGGVSSRKEPLVLIVAAYPEPRHHVTLQNPDCSKAKCDSHRPDIFFRADTFEMQ